MHAFLGVIDETTKPTMMTQVSYAANAGTYTPGMMGDGITPLEVAKLDQVQLTTIPNCAHFNYHDYVDTFGQYLLLCDET